MSKKGKAERAEQIKSMAGLAVLKEAPTIAVPMHVDRDADVYEPAGHFARWWPEYLGSLCAGIIVGFAILVWLS